MLHPCPQCQMGPALDRKLQPNCWGLSDLSYAESCLFCHATCHWVLMRMKTHWSSIGSEDVMRTFHLLVCRFTEPGPLPISSEDLLVLVLLSVSILLKFLQLWFHLIKTRPLHRTSPSRSSDMLVGHSQRLGSGCHCTAHPSGSLKAHSSCQLILEMSRFDSSYRVNL